MQCAANTGKYEVTNEQCVNISGRRYLYEGSSRLRANTFLCVKTSVNIQAATAFCIDLAILECTKPKPMKQSVWT